MYSYPIDFFLIDSKDDSPNYTAQNSPRASYSASFYDRNTAIANSTSGNVKVIVKI